MTEKLHLDFPRAASMCVLMPQHPQLIRRDPISAICLEAGRIMEDESVALALTLPTSLRSLAECLATVHVAGEDIAALAAAAQVLLRRGETLS